MEEIRRIIKNIGNGEVGLESSKDEEWCFGFDHAGQDVFMKECKFVLEDCLVANVEEERRNVFVLSKEARKRLPPLRGIEKHRLFKANRREDEVMNKIEVGNITELNDLVYAGAVVVSEILGVKNRKSTRIEPWWKRRMEAQVKQTNTLGILIP